MPAPRILARLKVGRFPRGRNASTMLRSAEHPSPHTTSSPRSHAIAASSPARLAIRQGNIHHHAQHASAFEERICQSTVVRVLVLHAVDGFIVTRLVVNVPRPPLRQLPISILSERRDAARMPGPIHGEVEQAQAAAEFHHRHPTPAGLDDPGVTEHLDDASREVWRRVVDAPRRIALRRRRFVMVIESAARAEVIVRVWLEVRRVVDSHKARSGRQRRMPRTDDSCWRRVSQLNHDPRTLRHCGPRGLHVQLPLP